MPTLRFRITTYWKLLRLVRPLLRAIEHGDRDREAEIVAEIDAIHLSLGH
ncbi:hypothetical protein [Nocardia nova]|nr:hypothetical protein [Nocardia nova]MBF6277019.1 hypothetical protein [Nocardia nova]